MFYVLKLKHITLKLYNNITENLVENDGFHFFTFISSSQQNVCP